MNAACASLGLVPGDSLDLLINLYTDEDGNKLPLQMDPGEVFVLTVGREVATTAANGPERLQVLATADRTTFSRQFTPAETSRFRQSGGQCGQPLEWSFVRIPRKGIRRTYARGPITLSAGNCAGPAIQTLDLIVKDGGVFIEMGGVPDVASYTDAREAAIRQDMGLQINQAETLAAAFALLL
ncbi:hypothetical protein [Methylobacterium sp. C1]|uniref:hypothetical protein n=1 Tax=Methylobacterium sp. C1 TaxID=1479019 RepID=UPI000A588430|nr:hypothetical protein [Methylobacterium sp. C1]